MLHLDCPCRLETRQLLRHQCPVREAVTSCLVRAGRDAECPQGLPPGTSAPRGASCCQVVALATTVSGDLLGLAIPLVNTCAPHF